MSGTFINYEEGSTYYSRIADPVTRHLTSIVFGILDLEGLNGNFSDGSFDVLFFVKVVEKAMSRHEAISRVLKGESLYWFDDVPPENEKAD